MVTTVTCPQCGKTVKWEQKELWKPFCSERCKLIDLGEWATEGHRIAGEPHFDPEQDPNDHH
ncbi:DNA gyrase inhibitor YacG [Methylophaga thiooxydans]|uniref:DNA gyrase inhibitor YacG n=1 Tax=Methylophaga thiooxydans TaxID=392484 RepID=UPI00235243E2|nr:DNA gyrase inhibitor YacG [Methylophaga thiooxydans]